MALLSFRGISTPSLTAQGEQRRFSFFNIRRDISVERGSPATRRHLARSAPKGAVTGRLLARA
jgi:hypothetical protein